MPQDLERAYVRNWRETGRLLDELRWRELRTLTESAAREASTALLSAACLVPFPPHRHRWSGLVELQQRLHGRR